MHRHDIPTAVAIGFTISVLSTFGHEALGHGAACVLVGCVPIQVSSSYFLGDEAALSSGAIRAISLGGTIFNLVLGLVFLAALRIVGTRAAKGRVQTRVVPAGQYYVLWFGAMSNLVSASGYILFGSAFRFGDYATILEGTGLPLRIGCVAVGGALYLGSLWVAARLADPLLGSGKDRRGRLFALVLLPKVATSVVLSGSALLSPYPEAAFFSFIGHLFPAIGAWGMLQWFVGDGTGEPAQPIERSRSWWVTSAVVAIVAAGVLGPGIPRSTRAKLESLRGDLTDPSSVARVASIRTALECPDCPVNGGTSDPIAHAWKHSARVWGDGARAEHITAWVSTSGEVLTQLDEQAPHESVWKKLGRTLGQDEEWPEARGSTRDSRWGARPAMKPGRVFPIAENNVDGL